MGGMAIAICWIHALAVAQMASAAAVPPPPYREGMFSAPPPPQADQCSDSTPGCCGGVICPDGDVCAFDLDTDDEPSKCCPGDQMYYCGGQCCPSTSQCVLKLNSEGSFTGLACCPVDAPFYCGGECCESTTGMCLRDTDGNLQCCPYADQMHDAAAGTSICVLQLR